MLLAALLGGAFAGFLASVFIWLVEGGTDLLWTDLPDRVGVEPYGTWWTFAVPIAGGALVGLGQRFLGNYPRPIDEAIATWRAGGHLDPRTVPRTVVNSLVALVFGGPVGFEAALTGLLGGTATLISTQLHRAGRFARQAWGAERIEAVPHAVQVLPFYLAGLAGLFTYKALPFGTIDVAFRFAPNREVMGADDAAVVAVFAALVTVPVAWAATAIHRAEAATAFRRSPVLIGMAGGLLFATLALGDDFVLFSGQQAIQNLQGLAVASLLYLTVAKVAALVIAYLAGWRGGPVFPSYLAVAALATAVSAGVGTPPDLVMIGGIAAVSAVFLKGRIPAAFVLSLYVVPLSYAGVILVGAAAAAGALALGDSLGIVPAPEVPPDPEGAPPAGAAAA